MRNPLANARGSVLLTLLACLPALAEPGSTWTLVRSPHFEVYSQAGEARARAALKWFEQLRAFFEQSGLTPAAPAPVRIIGFRSAKEYDVYRLRPGADAYYIGAENRDYIVMPSIGPGEFDIAAHEYVHEILHRSGRRLPLWLNEGLAELFSTLRIGERGCELGGDLPAHSQILQHRPWLPLPELLAMTAGSPSMRDRKVQELVYAESWALTEMLALSPEYAPQFHALIETSRILADIYGSPLETITRDLHAWVAGGRLSTVALPGVSLGAITSDASELTPSQARMLLADLLVGVGDLDRAEAEYRNLAQQLPENPEVYAAQGLIAFRKGNRQGALQAWKAAIDNGLADANLCFRYAMLASDAGLNPDLARAALKQAVALKPDFDDARFNLGLMESNAAEYEAALEQFHSMKRVAAGRAFGYWVAVSYALIELNRRDEAKAAAQEAMRFAATALQRGQAAQLAYTAQTDAAVQFTRDANGQSQLVMTRIPHGSHSWNPFIDQHDEIRRVEGRLRSVECAKDKITAVGVQTPEKSLILSIPDPSRVLMRNAPSEFFCGPQTGNAVSVEYAVSQNGADGVLRGMEFR